MFVCETEMICRSCIAPKDICRNGKWPEQLHKKTLNVGFLWFECEREGGLSAIQSIRKNIKLISFESLDVFTIGKMNHFHNVFSLCSKFYWSVSKGNFHFDLILIEFYKMDIAFCGLAICWHNFFLLRAHSFTCFGALRYLVDFASSVCSARTERLD